MRPPRKGCSSSAPRSTTAPANAEPRSRPELSVPAPRRHHQRDPRRARSDWWTVGCMHARGRQTLRSRTVRRRARPRVSPERRRGRIQWRGTTILLLTTTGRRSGEERTTPLIYRDDGDTWVVVASKGGAPDHPDWYKNLTAESDATIQVKAERIPVRAETAEGAERERLWQRMTEVWPDYDAYRRGLSARFRSSFFAGGSRVHLGLPTPRGRQAGVGLCSARCQGDCSVTCPGLTGESDEDGVGRRVCRGPNGEATAASTRPQMKGRPQSTAAVRPRVAAERLRARRRRRLRRASELWGSVLVGRERSQCGRARFRAALFL